MVEKRRLGAHRDLTNLFFSIKNQGSEPEVDAKSRFGLRKGGFLSLVETPMNDKGALLPTSTKASSDDTSSNSGSGSHRSKSASQLPPLYVDIQEEIESNLDDISAKMRQLKQLQMKRIKESFFDNDETIQLKIFETTADITQLIKQSESKLKELNKLELTQEEKADRQIRQNMQSILAERLKTVTFDLRRNEKDHFQKVQEIHGGNTQEDLEETKESGEMILEEEEYQSHHQSSEIQNLTKSINDLAILFKDLSVLVIEQGTILDRIDYNVEDASKSMVQANVHLTKTLKIEKSARARGCIIFLGVTIGVLCLIQVLKMM